MRHASHTNSKQRPVRRVGVGADAQALGVHVRTLQRVLKGDWQSRILTARYLQLKGEPVSRREALLISDYHRRQAGRVAT